MDCLPQANVRITFLHSIILSGTVLTETPFSTTFLKHTVSVQTEGKQNNELEPALRVERLVIILSGSLLNVLNVKQTSDSIWIIKTPLVYVLASNEAAWEAGNN